jgi:hypothetical protein
MKQYTRPLLSGLTIILAISCNAPAIRSHSNHSDSIYAYSANETNGGSKATLNIESTPRVLFVDQTQQVVSCAERLVQSNEKQGAALDQRWYGLQYFGKHPALIFSAEKVIFFGGLENQ